MGDGVRAASASSSASARGPLGSRRLLALAGDDRLVDQIQKGNDAAFEVAFERHAPAILGFCRHMLGSPDEAEDAVQQAFASAHRSLQRHPEGEIALKPWLFAIARNRCLSLLRARREEALEEVELPTAGLAEQVEQRADLRSLLADVRELPDEQRAALLLTELGDLSHAEVADALGCQVPRVKALVFRARSALIQRRAARETTCDRIQEELATARRGGLRRTELRLHLRDCAACRAYRAQVKQQRHMLAAALPVVPTLGLKSSVLAAVGIGGSAAGGGALGAGVLGAGLAKVALVGAFAGAGAVAGDAVLDPTPKASRSPDRAATATESVSPPAPSRVSERAPLEAGTVARDARPDPGDRPAKRKDRRSGPRARDRARAVPPGQAVRGAPARGNASQGRGRGPSEAPPAETPVRRGPPATPPGAAKAPQKPAPPVRPTPPAQSSKPSRTARP